MPDTFKLSCGVQAICFSTPEMRCHMWGFATSLVRLIVRRRRNVIRHNELCVSSIKAAINLHFGHRRTENSSLI